MLSLILIIYAVLIPIVAVITLLSVIINACVNFDKYNNPKNPNYYWKY